MSKNSSLQEATTEEAIPAQENGQPVPPTKEQVIAFLTEQIEMKTLQNQLQQLNTQIAINRAEEMKAVIAISHMSNPPQQGPPPDAIPHIVTQEDLDQNPDLAEQGVKVGDEVLIENTQKERSLKKS